MNVTVFGPYALYQPHFETELEIIEGHLERGDEVTFIACDRALESCELNPDRDHATCATCFDRVEAGLRLLRGKVRVLRLSGLLERAAERTRALPKFPEVFSSYKELCAFRLGERHDAGAAVASSLNSLLRDPAPDPGPRAPMVSRALRAAAAVHEALTLYLETMPCDQFYVFNGRLPNLRAALRACQRTGTRCSVHERGCDFNSYILAHDTLPHDIEENKRHLREHLSRASAEEIEREAEAFYRDRKKGMIYNWISYTQAQVRGTLPGAWVEAPERIAIFTSTEEEMAALPEYYQNPIYPSQKEGLLRLLPALFERGFQGRVAVRAHPNSANTKSDMTPDILALGLPGVDVIPPADKVDSYALVDRADKVLVFGSTIGMEAAYWGTPTILAGRSIYEESGSVHVPRSHEELLAMLLNPLEAKPRRGAAEFGYYMRTYGDPFRFVAAQGVNECTFKGVGVRVSPRLGRHLKRLRRHPLLARVLDAGHRFRQWRLTGRIGK